MQRAKPVRTLAMGASVHGIGGGLGWSLLPTPPTLGMTETRPRALRTGAPAFA